MQYKFYDPPLNFFSIPSDSQKPEDRATIEDILKIEEASRRNFDRELALIDYALQLGFITEFYIDADSILSCRPCIINYNRIAICYGGSVAIYRECIKRNVTILQLFGIDDPEEEEETIEEYCYYDIPEEEYTRPGYSHEDCIAFLKERREEYLARQRWIQQAKQ